MARTQASAFTRFSEHESAMLRRPLTLTFAIALLGLALLGSRSVAAQEAGSSPPPERPSTDVRRFEEDWSQARHFAASDFWDPAKFVPLDSDGDYALGFGGDLRLRGEVWSAYGFGSAAENDDVYGLSRVRLHANAQLSEYFRLFVEGKSALATERLLAGQTLSRDVDALDLQNLFADLILPLWTDAELRLRIGFQELSMGSERLLSPDDWSNSRRTFDGLSFNGDLEVLRFELFCGYLVPVTKYGLNKTDTEDTLCSAAVNTELGKHSLLGFWLWREQEVPLASERVKEVRQTFGLELAGPLPTGFDAFLMGAAQVGKRGDVDVRAGHFAAELSLRTEHELHPHLAAGIEFASGDLDPLDDTAQTADALFPTSRHFLGLVGAVGRQNVVALRLSSALEPLEGLVLGLDGFVFHLARPLDALYDDDLGAVRLPQRGGASYVGSELDAVARYQMDRHASFIAAYAHVFAGDFVAQTGVSGDVDFAMFQYSYVW